MTTDRTTTHRTPPHRTLQFAALSTAAVLAAVTGCQTNETSLNALLAPEPPESLVFADTTQPARDYPRSVATIPNGDTAAEANGARWRSRDDLNVALIPVVEPLIFIGNAVTLPYTLIEQRGTVVSSGLQFPPTHNAMPPLPDEQSPPQPAPADGAGESAPPVLETPGTPATQEAPEALLRPTTRPTEAAFTISGQVLRPGTYEATDAPTLSRAIAAAGPSTEDATKVRVQIDRPGEESAVTTLDQLTTGAVEDVAVRPGDTITISVLP